MRKQYVHAISPHTIERFQTTSQRLNDTYQNLVDMETDDMAEEGHRTRQRLLMVEALRRHANVTFVMVKHVLDAINDDKAKALEDDL